LENQKNDENDELKIKEKENDLRLSDTDSSREGKQENDMELIKKISILTHKNSELRKQLALERVEAIQEKADFTKRISELEKQVNDEKSMSKTLKNKKNKYQKEKANILDFLEREVTCPVCLMIPRTKKIPICRNGHTTCETCKR